MLLSEQKYNLVSPVRLKLCVCDEEKGRKEKSKKMVIHGLAEIWA